MSIFELTLLLNALSGLISATAQIVSAVRRDG